MSPGCIIRPDGKVRLPIQPALLVAAAQPLVAVPEQRVEPDAVEPERRELLAREAREERGQPGGRQPV